VRIVAPLPACDVHLDGKRGGGFLITQASSLAAVDHANGAP